MTDAPFTSQMLKSPSLHFSVCMCVCVCSVLPTGCLSACGGDRLEREGVNTGKLEKKDDNVRSLKCSKNSLIYFSPGGIYLSEFPNECESLV